MRTSGLVLWALCLSNMTLAKDPTVPGSLLRLPPTSVKAEQSTPELKVQLKAMVMQDADHASVILAAGDQKVTLHLDRNRPVRFQLHGRHFEVVDFWAKNVDIRPLP